MTLTIDTTGTPDFIKLNTKFTDVRGQTARLQLLLDPTTSDGTLQFIAQDIDGATNAKFEVDVEKVWIAPGAKSAVDAVEANLSEVMMLVLTATNPVTGAGKVSGKVPIYAMKRAIENFPAGTLNTSETHISALIGWLNSNLTFKASDGTYHPGLLQVVPLDSQHITEEDLIDTV